MLWSSAASSQQPDLSVVIVNYNTDGLLRECVDSIIASSEDLMVEVLVVDNDSHDGSADFLEQYPSVSFTRNPRNVGFACANNQALASALGRLVLLLNPDTLVLPGTLRKLVLFLEHNPGFGAVCPRTYLDRERSLEVCTLKIPTPYNSILVHTPLRRILPRNPELERIWRMDLELWNQSEGAYEVEGIGGACFMLSRKTMDRIGLLDERFYMGYEDTDWSLKIRRLGLRIAILTDAEIIHYFGQSKRKVDRNQLPIMKWKHGLLPFLMIHYPGWQTLSFRILKTLSETAQKAVSHFAAGSKEQQTKDSGPPNGLRFEWRSDSAVRWLLEISNSPVFFDKFGAKICGDTFIVSQDVLARLATGRYWWRLFPALSYDLFNPAAQGVFTVP